MFPDPVLPDVPDVDPDAAPDAASSATLDAAMPQAAGVPTQATAAALPEPAAPAADPSPAACAQHLKRLFPALFAGAPKPLKLRIQVDIQERAPGVFTKQALSAFFRRHTGSTGYLIAVSRARQRFDLDGQPAGDLSDEHRQAAHDELARRRTNHESRLALEEQQRRNRATLLHDFEITTLTPANFCALKGIAVDELEGYLATARREADERARQAPAFDAAQGPARRRPGPGPGPGPEARRAPGPESDQGRHGQGQGKGRARR